ncbi:DUF2142 domain-containing protein [Rhizosaccharibacter radicis]|uniref:DUF2142 domain-containing protein n=1 Tax=Rhizosaccharibacter radicis TaxID=2782605 RepID=A0ABT1VVX1_9PROT|nr:DUF2142 domain-containing protein [Acetobacteraceae bacterium KSS12]
MAGESRPVHGPEAPRLLWDLREGRRMVPGRLGVCSLRLFEGKRAGTDGTLPAQARFAAMFLALFLPLGLFLSGSLPLGQVPDEPAHVLRAESLLHGEWIGERRTRPDETGRVRAQEGVMADPAMLDALSTYPHPNDHHPVHVSGGDLARGEAARFHDHTSFMELGTIASYSPIFYVPSALAIGATRATRGTPHTAFLAARLCNLVLFGVMGGMALLLARRGRALLLATLLLPTSVSLAGSLSQDGLIIAATVLAAACMSRVGAEAEPWRSPSFLAAGVLVAAIVLAKPPYLPVASLLLLPLRLGAGRRWPPFAGQRLGAILLVMLLASCWTWLTVRYCSSPIVRAPEEAGPLWPGSRPAVFDATDMGAQLRVLLARPWLFVTLPFHTIRRFPDVFTQLLGVLGWINLVLPKRLLALWAAALLAALLADGGAVGGRTLREGSSWQEALLLGGAAFATLLLIYLSQYLSFTPVGYDWISGVQGRYLVPLLPLLALAVPVVPAWSRSRLPGWLLVVPAVAGLASLYAVPRAVIAFYYAGP